jgi:hypothetical protein
LAVHNYLILKTSIVMKHTVALLALASGVLATFPAGGNNWGGNTGGNTGGSDWSGDTGSGWGESR